MLEEESCGLVVNDLRSLCMELVDVGLIYGDGCLFSEMVMVCVNGMCNGKLGIYR